jgi:branched-chain amino acid transport system substrate-binding protein
MNKKLLSGLIGAVVIGSLLLFGITSCKKKEPETIKIGAILPLTGELSYLGEPGKNAIELIRERYGNEVKIYLYDSKGDPKTGLTVFQQALNFDKIRIFLTTLTGVSMAIKPVAKNYGVLQAIIAIYPHISADYEFAFQFCYNAETEAKILIDYLNKIKAKKIFFFASRDPITELQINEYFKPNLQNRMIIERFDMGTKNFKDLVSKFKFSNSDIGVLLGYGSDFQGILKELAQQGLIGKVKLLGGIGYLELPNYVNYDMVKGSIFAVPKFIVENTQEYQEFSKLYKSRFKKDPTYDAIYTYDALQTIIKAYKQLRTDNVKLISEYLLTNTFNGISGTIKFTSDRMLVTEAVLGKFDKDMRIISITEEGE